MYEGWGDCGLGWTEKRASLPAMAEKHGGNTLPEGARYIHQIPATPLVPVSVEGAPEIWCKLEFLNPSGSMVDVLEEARQASEKEGWFLGRQFVNTDNTEAHRLYTGAEILSQIPGGCVDAVVSGVGTGGTLRGLYEAFHQAGCRVSANAAIPRQGELFGSNLECCSLKFSSDVPGVADGISELYGEWDCEDLQEREVGDGECLELTRKLWGMGFPVGPSSGLNFAAALQVAGDLKSGAKIVTVFPDRMERYFSHKVFDGYRS